MLLILTIYLCEAKLLYFTEVCRHGARSPKHFMPWDTEKRWPNGSKNLVSEGLRQHYLLGKYLRKRYITDFNFLSETYNSKELKVYSTSVTRTIFSMESQLMGLYPQQNMSLDHIFKSSYLTKTPSINKKPLIPIFLDEKKIEPMLLIEDYCEPYKNDSKLRKSYLKKFKRKKSYQFISDTVEAYFKSINQEKIPHELRVLASVISNKFMGFSIPPVFDDLWYNKTRDLHIKMKEYIKYDNKYSRTLAASEFLNHLLHQFESKIRGITQRKATIYSAHDTTLMNIFAALNVPLFEPPFASILIFELHENDNEFFIKTIFNDLPLTLPFCSGTLCDLSTFQSFVSSNTFKNVTEACLNFPSGKYLTKPNSEIFDMETDQVDNQDL